eukprot:m.779141 g.779141  ORF g.779141 m.779141 type:complete len:450 (+) comp23277_c0_seq11:184-1533(+)
MGCGTSTAESAPPIAPPAPLSRDAVVPEWAYGKYSVEILDLGITAANATFSASGLQWNDAVPRLPVLESTTNTFVFAMEGCSFRVNFDPQNQHTIPALFQAAAGQPWSKAVVTRLPGECPRETVMPVVSTSTLQRYNQLQSEMDELASADVHAEDLEGKIAYLRAQQEEANKNIAKWKAELEQISAANPGFNGYEPSAVDPNSDAYQRFVKATDGLQFAHAETTATASEIADMEAANSKSKVRAETLENLLQEESELLGSIFGGKYGSPLEQRLEEQERALSTQLSSVQHTKSNWLQAHDWLGKGAHSTLAMAQESCQQAVHEATQGATRSNTQIMFESGTLARLRDTLQQSYTTLARTWYFLPDVRLPYLGGEHMNVLYALGREVFARAMQPDGLVHMLRYIEDIRSRTAGAQGWVGDVINKRIMGDYAATGAPRKFVLGALRVPLPQ